MTDRVRKNDIVFDLSPYQDAFVFSDAHVVFLVGPMGEGKTFAAIAGIINHANRCGCDIRGALVRDTHTNIKISTVPDIKSVLKDMVSFHDDYKKMIIHSRPYKVEMDLFGIDDPAAMSKLQGPQYAIIWLEEPAPIIEKANAGLPVGVYRLAIARAARQAGTILRVQITQNPADEEHWTTKEIYKPRVVARDPDTGVEIIKECFRIPRGDNKYLSPLSRAANIAAFQDDPGMYARYVEGREAPVLRGKKVTPEYNPSLHFMHDVELPVVKGAIGIRGWDSYQNPACVIGQWVPPGRLIIHDVCYDTNIGPKELIEQQVKPLLATSKYRGLIHQWRDIGDPSMRTADQSSVSSSAARVVEDLLNTRFEPGPTFWDHRIRPLKSALLKNATDGKPSILLSKTAYLLHRALNGGWHWKTDNSNRVVGSLPVKDEHSHPADAFSYPVALLFPYDALRKDIRELRNMSQRERMSVAMSYAPKRRRRA